MFTSRCIGMFSYRGFHSSCHHLRRRPFNYPAARVTVKDENSVDTIAVAPLYPSWTLKEFAKNIITRSELNKHDIEKTLEKERNDRHEIARKNIVEGQVKLGYREMQRLCKLNGLGKANATGQVLEKRLLTFFRRLDPEKVQAMGFWELVNIKDNLDGDGEPTEDDRAEYGEADDRKSGLSADDMNMILGDRRYPSFIADPPDLRELYERMARQEAYDSLTGRFFAAPAPTGRATCRYCHEKIAKGCVRVTEQCFERFYNKGGRGSWTPRKKILHFHAGCFLYREGIKDVDVAKDVTPSDLHGEEAYSLLRDAIMKTNKEWEDDAEWNQFLSAAVFLEYPGDTMYFGFSNEPGEFQVTALNREEGPFSHVLKMRSERNTPKDERTTPEDERTTTPKDYGTTPKDENET